LVSFGMFLMVSQEGDRAPLGGGTVPGGQVDGLECL